MSKHLKTTSHVSQTKTYDLKDKSGTVGVRGGVGRQGKCTTRHGNFKAFKYITVKVMNDGAMGTFLIILLYPPPPRLCVRQPFAWSLGKPSFLEPVTWFLNSGDRIKRTGAYREYLWSHPFHHLALPK